MYSGKKPTENAAQQKPKEKVWTKEDDMARKIQTKFRQYRAKKALEKKKKEKEEYEELMERLEKEVYINPLPDDNNLDLSKLKQIADDILKCI